MRTFEFIAQVAAPLGQLRADPKDSEITQHTKVCRAIQQLVQSSTQQFHYNDLMIGKQRNLHKGHSACNASVCSLRARYVRAADRQQPPNMCLEYIITPQ